MVLVHTSASMTAAGGTGNSVQPRDCKCKGVRTTTTITRRRRGVIRGAFRPKTFARGKIVTRHHPFRPFLPGRFVVDLDVSHVTDATSRAAAAPLKAATSEEVVTGNGSEPLTTLEEEEEEEVEEVEEESSSAGLASNGRSNGVANGLANGNGVAQAAVDNLDACDAGQLESCAQTSPQLESTIESRAASGGTSEGGQGENDRWSRLKNTSTLKRTIEIWTFVITFFFKLFVVNQKWNYTKAQRDKEAKGGISKEAKSEKLAELAIWVRTRLVELGPTFIKIGQQFSTRSDILSPEFIAELVKLQDRVPAFPSDIAMATIEKELGVKESWREKFSYLETEPIAAASLGQVHRAVLKDGKTQVVIKVQRPDLKELFDVDTKNIRFVAQILQNIDPKTDGAARDWVAIYDECCRILYQEIDYKLEGKYADSFRENFSDLPWVKVPKVYWDLTTEKVLTLEYSPGIKVSDKAALVAKGVDPAVIARYSVECYLQQILVKGLFHADPHPGNIAVDASDPADPKLIFYDFGMMGKIPNNVREGLSNLFYSVFRNDVDGAIDGLMDMGVIKANSSADMTAIKRTGAFFLNSFKTRLREQREERKRAKAAMVTLGKPKQKTKQDKQDKRKKILSNIGQDLLVVANDQPFRFPALFTFVVRAFSVLDGIGKSLDPRFDISEISAPYARDLLLETRPGFSKLRDNYERGAERQWEATKGLFVAPLKIQRIENILDSLERGDVKLRVRALEAERALQRVSIMQTITACVAVAAVSLNTATILSVAANTAPPLVKTMCFSISALFGFLTLKNMLVLKKLNKKEKQIMGMA